MKMVTNAQILELVDDGNIVIDVRSAILYRDSHVKGTINVPFNVFGMRISLFKNKKIFILISEIEKNELAIMQRYCEELKIKYSYLMLAT